jgi:hypothetical protein
MGTYDDSPFNVLDRMSYRAIDVGIANARYKEAKSTRGTNRCALCAVCAAQGSERSRGSRGQSRDAE